MKRLCISHLTEYFYTEPVTFGTHRVLVRPREGHDVHIESSRLEISPPSILRWIRDIYGNSIALVHFLAPATQLRIFSEVIVRHYDANPLDFLIDPTAITYPFSYSMEELTDLIPYRLAAYPQDSAILSQWLLDLYKPGQLHPTLDLLSTLNRTIFEQFTYIRREEQGIQTPAHTLATRSGSCRDFAALMMEAARHWGFGSRFVSGYLQTSLDEGQHGATHAWTEIYIPGAGWRGFDPTTNQIIGMQHVSVAVARDPEKASPISGSWQGHPSVFLKMHVHVEVNPL